MQILLTRLLKKLRPNFGSFSPKPGEHAVMPPGLSLPLTPANDIRLESWHGGGVVLLCGGFAPPLSTEVLQLPALSPAVIS